MPLVKSTYQASNGNPSALFLVPRENLSFGLAYFVAFVVFECVLLLLFSDIRAFLYKLSSYCFGLIIHLQLTLKKNLGYCRNGSN